MTFTTVLETEQRTGLGAPTLRYYEEIGLIGPVARDERSGHRRYSEQDLDALQALACLRAMGVGIDDMRTYQRNREAGGPAAEQRDLLNRHRERIEQQIATLTVHLGYLEAKAALWDARARGSAADEAEAALRVQAVLPHLEAAIR